MRILPNRESTVTRTAGGVDAIDAVIAAMTEDGARVEAQPVHELSQAEVDEWADSLGARKEAA